MKKTKIAREFEKEIYEETKEHEEELRKNLQDIAKDIHNIVYSDRLKKEEEKELYDLYSYLILNIKDITINIELLDKWILDIENYEETELKDE